jgi:hypothetical protein
MRAKSESEATALAPPQSDGSDVNDSCRSRALHSWPPHRRNITRFSANLSASRTAASSSAPALSFPDDQGILHSTLAFAAFQMFGPGLCLPHHTSHVTRHTPHVTRHMSHATRHTSHATRCKSHITRHTSYTLQLPVSTSRKRYLLWRRACDR